MLFEFHTGLAFGKDSLYYKIFSKFPSKVFNKISNRFIDEVPDSYIRRKPLIEIKALIRLKFRKDEEDVLYRRNMHFQNSISDSIILASDAVIGFDTSSWIMAERCRELSRKFFLDVSIAHPVAKEKVYRQIIKLYPTWEFSVKTKDYKHIAVEEAEMELASQIVVASYFTFKTYKEHSVPADKISIIPYGVDSQMFKPLADKKTGSTIRFVYVGTVDARKGIPLLLEAWGLLKHENIELTLIGPISMATEKYIRNLYPAIIIKGKLAFSEVVDTLPNYDVMIFPSFFEGFGLVIPQAMASGLPVITTSATCGPDIISNGVDGFIVEPGNVENLLESIDFFLSKPEMIHQFGLKAIDKIKGFSWDAYGAKWKELLESSVN